MNSVQNLCEYFWYLENKYDLLRLEINGVYVWQSSRLELYYKIGQALNIFESSLDRELSLKDKLKKTPSLILNSTLRGKYKKLKKADVIVVSHPRSKVFDGSFRDIYTHFLQKELKNHRISYIELEEHFKGEHLREYNQSKVLLDFINIKKGIFSKFHTASVTHDTQVILSDLNSEITSKVGQDLQIDKYLLKQTVRFEIAFEEYKKILSKINPKKIYLVVSYGYPELIKAAKYLCIEVIELQHGTFSKYHLGYSYPYNKELVQYFPDRFLAWNVYWKNLISFPISAEKIEIRQFDYLTNKKREYKGIEKVSGKVVILSQAGLTEQIARKIEENINFFIGFDVVFKLHPQEYGKIDSYQVLNNLINNYGFKLLEDCDLYHVLAESQYQVGVFSTALFEGVEFECTTILLNLPGIEYMEKFIEQYEPTIL